MNEPLRQRAVKEIGWAQELARRLARSQPAPDLSAELAQLEALSKRLAEPSGASARVPAEPAEALQGWIWYPEGRPTEGAPAAARFFRCRFEAPTGGRAAELRIAADDACEVFLNGTRVGAHDTWQRTAVFSVGALLKPGRNVLAVRAENKPAPSKNPAGLIARLTMTLATGKQAAVVSDSSWRSAKDEQPQWEQAAFDDSTWKPAIVAAPFGEGPWLVFYSPDAA
jgi:alpha-L-rhamnosidase